MHAQHRALSIPNHKTLWEKNSRFGVVATIAACSDSCVKSRSFPLHGSACTEVVLHHTFMSFLMKITFCSKLVRSTGRKKMSKEIHVCTEILTPPCTTRLWLSRWKEIFVHKVVHRTSIQRCKKREIPVSAEVRTLPHDYECIAERKVLLTKYHKVIFDPHDVKKKKFVIWHGSLV